MLSDEAHRTQAGKFARNLRLALPNAAFIGFTGTPLFKYDHLTRRIFGSYVSRDDFRRAEEDGSTVRLVYENRGEKLGVTTLDLNDRLAEAVEAAGARCRPGRAPRTPARQGLRDHHRRRPPREDRARLRRALLRALGGRQGDARVHRQGHLRPMLALVRPLWDAKTAAVQREADALAAQAEALPEGEEQTEAARRTANCSSAVSPPATASRCRWKTHSKTRHTPSASRSCARCG